MEVRRRLLRDEHAVRPAYQDRTWPGERMK